MKKIALVGFGAIGRAVLESLRNDAELRVVQVLVSETKTADGPGLLAELAPEAHIGAELQLHGNSRPDLIVECAGHGALQQHVVPALRAGIPAVVVSVGALHDGNVLDQLATAAEQGKTRVSLVPGAIGGIDALASARLGGLSDVTYIGRKPALAWLGTQAEALCDLRSLAEPRVIYDGSAREAARLYPKNANVAATVSLAGLGLDATRVQLIADPTLTRNVHRIVATGTFGRFDISLENETLPTNPKTSALTVYSVLRAIRNASRPISI
jgi:aspartate dehydrogenase